MSIVDLENCWITFNVREDQLKNLTVGKTIKASVPAIGKTNIDFKITYVKALGSYATWKATKTTSEFDVKTFEIRAKPVHPIEGLRPGMSVLLEEAVK